MSNMKTNLSEKIAIVTGGAKGYGAGIAEALQAAGAKVWITGRNEKTLQTTAQQLGVHALRADVTSPADWDRLLDQVLQTHGRLDILVNNAGHAVRIQPVADQTDETLQQSIATNLTGAMLGCRRAAPVMKRQQSGTLINISSVCAQYAWPGWAAYSAAKAGLVQFSKCLYTELREHGVRVTTLTPSWGATDFAATDDLAGHPARDPKIRAQCMQPLELGHVVAHICEMPAHLAVLNYTVLPTVQEIMPL